MCPTLHVNSNNGSKCNEYTIQKTIFAKKPILNWVMINILEEASRCLLCQDAPCSKACRNGDPARAIRAIRFDNAKNALNA